MTLSATQNPPLMSLQASQLIGKILSSLPPGSSSVKLHPLKGLPVYRVKKAQEDTMALLREIFHCRIDISSDISSARFPIIQHFDLDTQTNVISVQFTEHFMQWPDRVEYQNLYQKSSTLH